ncbi:MAG: ABC transporter permease [Flavisolibacter sp.]
MNLLISLRSEIFKTKRTAAFYFTLIGAAIIPFMFLLNALTHGLPDEDESNKDPMNAIFMLSAQMVSLGIFPLFIVLICTLLPQIEHKNNTWKQVLTSPQSKANVFLAKFLNIHLLILLFLVANHLFLWLVAIAIHFIIPELNVLQQPLNYYSVLGIIGNTYLFLLAVCAIQFWIGLRFKNFIVSIAIGLAMWLTGTVLKLEYNSDFANYFPYSFQTFTFAPGDKSELNVIGMTSIGYTVFFLAVGFLDFRRRRMNG